MSHPFGDDGWYTQARSVIILLFIKDLSKHIAPLTLLRISSKHSPVPAQVAQAHEWAVSQREKRLNY